MFMKKKIARATLVKTQDYDEAVDLVLNNKVDLMVADMTTYVLAVMRHPDSKLTTLKAPLNMEPIGIAISSEDTQFANLLSNYLATFRVDMLRKKWMENDAWISSIP